MRQQTVKVMGGEDWERWIDQLTKAGRCSFSGLHHSSLLYVGPEVSQAIYRQGTIGKAKEHLGKYCRNINKKMSSSAEQLMYLSIRDS